MLYYLKNLTSVWGPFRLFEYQTVRAVLAGATALVIGFIIAPFVLEKLRNLRHSERDLNGIVKDGGKVPVMGGFIVLIPALISSLLLVRMNLWVVVALIIYLGMSLVGFFDDYLKVKKNNSDGISGRVKLLGQGACALIAMTVLFVASDEKTFAASLEVWVPFLKTAVLMPDSFPLWGGILLIVAFFTLVTVSSSNAVNLTDGLDGLAIGCVITTTLTFGVIAYLSGHVHFAKYLQIGYVPGGGELAVLCSALLGGSLVFLWYNAEPAEVYMGDIGSLGLGGVIGAIAFMTHQPFLLIVAGGVFVAEALSVMIQVVWFKHTGGRRVFLMSPIHHHFQKKGWRVSKIVIRFWLLSLLCGIASLITLKLR
ncbi:MAG: phospho-N-acetylmuramoyl-pentapeptide-transferase [Puniceicoccales bacterium]|jgi:phospho-N-acetylmuramoyl-pentapeptide-transferase|nr:phospho-N-acetylmuramoyl-pentapeptide-transferase [Puniceicoccales bacterium]